ncbi:MAG: SUMF1/EgtB/PvdO family nonheme iron enzyme, partial [Halioglobus sp.]|nr:SUMF1/EgtB/PvdO family nonheme iron enzyme [Halioglobus sp.]
RGTGDGQPEGQRYPWGDTISDADANYNFNTADRDTTEVGSYPATGYGLYDMAGNVWEWVADWYDDSYYSSVHASSDNPRGPSNGVRRVSRGGSFDHDAFGLRNSARCDFCHQDRHGNNLGARCAR